MEVYTSRSIPAVQTTTHGDESTSRPLCALSQPRPVLHDTYTDVHPPVRARHARAQPCELALERRDDTLYERICQRGRSRRERGCRVRRHRRRGEEQREEAAEEAVQRIGCPCGACGLDLIRLSVLEWALGKTYRPLARAERHLAGPDRRAGILGRGRSGRCTRRLCLARRLILGRQMAGGNAWTRTRAEGKPTVLG